MYALISNRAILITDLEYDTLSPQVKLLWAFRDDGSSQMIASEDVFIDGGTTLYKYDQQDVLKDNIQLKGVIGILSTKNPYDKLITIPNNFTIDWQKNFYIQDVTDRLKRFQIMVQQNGISAYDVIPSGTYIIDIGWKYGPPLFDDTTNPSICPEAILYDITGQNTDGAMTQKATTDNLDKKVDKVDGLGLSQNSFSTTEKEKLATLQNYDDTIIKQDINNLNINKADLVDGLVPASQLPSYVDDVLTYPSLDDFPADGVDGKIYVAKDTNFSYRWSGTAYSHLDPSLALGETSSTAFAGNRGKALETAIVSINDELGTKADKLNIDQYSIPMRIAEGTGVADSSRQATAASLADTLVSRDGAGRTKVIAGVDSEDVVNKGQLDDVTNNTVLIKNASGGFAAGGSNTSATYGGAVGYGASATFGGAVGNSSSATTGGAVGSGATTTVGGAVGNSSSATTGGAVGYNAKTGEGFAGGYNAKTRNGTTTIDAVQLGTGTNPTPKTLQVYDYPLMGATGDIPMERLTAALNTWEDVTLTPASGKTLPGYVRLNRATRTYKIKLNAWTPLSEIGETMGTITWPTGFAPTDGISVRGQVEGLILPTVGRYAIHVDIITNGIIKLYPLIADKSEGSVSPMNVYGEMYFSV